MWNQPYFLVKLRSDQDVHLLHSDHSLNTGGCFIRLNSARFLMFLTLVWTLHYCALPPNSSTQGRCRLFFLLTPHVFGTWLAVSARSEKCVWLADVTRLTADSVFAYFRCATVIFAKYTILFMLSGDSWSMRTFHDAPLSVKHWRLAGRFRLTNLESSVLIQFTCILNISRNTSRFSSSVA